MAISNCIFWIILVTISSVASEGVELEDHCRTDIYNGTCKGISTCQYAIRLLTKNEYKTLKSIFCGFVGNEPKVCCPLEHSINTISYKDTEETATSRPKPVTKTQLTTREFQTTTVLPVQPVQKELSVKTEQPEQSVQSVQPEHPDQSDIFPDRLICGTYQGEDKIYGGSLAAIDEFPWLARIKFLSPSGKETYSCSGSLITHRYVLTAAHCVTAAKVLSVRLGEWNSQAEVDCYNEQCNTEPLDVAVDAVIPFPGYNKKNYTRGDIALLHLAQSVNFTAYIQPICLPTTDYTAMKDYDRESTYVTAGWGMTELEKESAVKRKVSLNAVPIDVCRAALSVIPDTSVPYIICAGGKKGEDSCRGDSGGPLVKLVQENYRINWFLYGVTSLGAKNCGTEGIPGTYTRVTAYMSWIRRNVRT